MELLPLRHIPHWPKFIAMVHTLHRVDRGDVLLGWDVAITDSGASLVEVNGVPSIHLWQMACGRGLRDAQGRQFLAALEASARRIRHRSWRRAGRWLSLR